MSGRLDGRVCLITGTGGAMGNATALTFAREGALVVGCDVAVGPAEQTLAAVEAAGGQMVSLQACILRAPSQRKRVGGFAAGEVGPRDGLFHFVGRSRA